MAFTITLLFVAFLVEQLYALNFHFPHPASGLVYPWSLQLLKGLSAGAAIAAWSSIAHDSPSQSAYVAALSSLFFVSSLALFAWTTTIARPQQLSVIYGRVTPSYVLSSGPFALVRHPTYVAYALGWMGAVIRALTARGSETQSRVMLLILFVTGLFWLYRKGAILEEEQFLQDHETVAGQKVGESVRVEYLAYMRRVPYRWIPSVV